MNSLYWCYYSKKVKAIITNMSQLKNLGKDLSSNIIILNLLDKNFN